MPSRQHLSSNGKVRVTVSTIQTNLAVYIEWGAEAWRERKYKLESVWWQPWTWSRYEWRREGTPPIFEDLAFYRGNGDRIPDTILNPAVTNQTGYRKESVVYFFGGEQPDDLGNDARSVDRMVVSYPWNGETRTLTAE